MCNPSQSSGNFRTQIEIALLSEGCLYDVAICVSAAQSDNCSVTVIELLVASRCFENLFRNPT